MFGVRITPAVFMALFVCRVLTSQRESDETDTEAHPVRVHVDRDARRIIAIIGVWRGCFFQRSPLRANAHARATCMATCGSFTWRWKVDALTPTGITSPRRATCGQPTSNACTASDSKPASTRITNPVYGPFDPAYGKLAPYLGFTPGSTEAKIKMAHLRRQLLPRGRRSGGRLRRLWMNDYYLGSQEYNTRSTGEANILRRLRSTLRSPWSLQRTKPVCACRQTILFADNESGRPPTSPGQVIPGQIMEYSFVEPNYFTNAEHWDSAIFATDYPNPSYSLDTWTSPFERPSINFRHSGNANIAWWTDTSAVKGR